MKVKESESEVAQSCPPLCDPLDHQAPPSMGFSRQEYWSGIPKKGNVKESSNCCTIALVSHASKLKILQARLQQYVNRELPDVQAGFRKGGGTEIKLPTSTGSQIRLKPLTVWITTNCGKFFKRWGYQTTLLPPEKPVCQSKSNS